MKSTSAVGKYSKIFPFKQFNELQSVCFNQIFNDDKSLVISAPTGSGKTVLFEIAILKCALESQNTTKFKCAYLAPTKALCAERYRDWLGRFKKVGLECDQLTGDSEDIVNLNAIDILITTPEKLDALTRVRETLDVLLKSGFKLLLLDEIHKLSEPRGAIIETIVSRFKINYPKKGGGGNLRFIAISAGISNPEDIRDWLSSQGRPAQIQTFDENQRVVPLYQHVLAFPSEGMNHFQFDNTLIGQLSWVVEKYSESLPCLIFCSTRKSAERSAFTLAEGMMATIGTLPSTKFMDSKLDEIVQKGVAFHNAGLSFEDRRAIEHLFLNGKLKVLCATSTLAIGVNLPAHLVIIKGTRHYTNDGYVEYSSMDIRQMTGRAGRPQYDSFGVAVIMTTFDRKEFYEKSAESPIVESALGSRLSEVLAAEIGIGTIGNFETAKSWLKSTLYFIRCKKSPRLYGLESNRDILKQLEDLLVDQVASLERAGLLKICKETGKWICTLWMRTILKFCLSIHSMKVLCSVPEGATQADILMYISKAFDQEDFKFQARDKNYLTKASSFNKTIKFKLNEKEKVTFQWQKAFIAIQIVLSRDDTIKMSLSLGQDCKIIMAKAKRMVRCLILILATKQSSISLFNSIELEGALNGEVWHDSSSVTSQVAGIGPAYASTLNQVGITSINDLRDTEPAKIEYALKRNPPFGHQLHQALNNLPVTKLASSYKTRGDGELFVDITSETNCISKSNFYLMVVACDQSQSLLFYECQRGSGQWHNLVKVKNPAFTSNVKVSLMCSSHAGLNIHHNLVNNHYSAPRFDQLRLDQGHFEPSVGESSLRDCQLDDDLVIVVDGGKANMGGGKANRGSGKGDGSDNPILQTNPPVKTITSWGIESLETCKRDMKANLVIINNCKHNCKDKKKCKHQCCKGFGGSKTKKIKPDGNFENVTLNYDKEEEESPDLRTLHLRIPPQKWIGQGSSKPYHQPIQSLSDSTTSNDSIMEEGETCLSATIGSTIIESFKNYVEIFN